MWRGLVQVCAGWGGGFVSGRVFVLLDGLGQVCAGGFCGLFGGLVLVVFDDAVGCFQ